MTDAARPTRAAAGLATRLTRRGFIAWTVALAAMVTTIAATYESAYPTALERRALVVSVGDNPAFNALYGPGRSLDTTGGFLEWRIGTGLALLAGLWGLLVATRLLRGEEQEGRVDMFGAGALRPTRLLAVQLAVIALGFAVVALAVGGAAAALGLGVGGSLAMGAGVGLVGAVFAALGALASQFAITRRQAASWCGLALGASYIVRAAGDGLDVPWLSWVSPLGWMQQLHPLTGGSAAVLLVPLGALIVIGAAAIGLRSRRDLGDTVVALTDRGVASNRNLGSPLAFAVRTNRGIALAWALGIGAYMALFGVLAPDVIDFARNSAMSRITQQMAGVSMDSVDGFFGLAFSLLTVVLAVLAATLVASMREEESAGRLDNLLVRPVRRLRWFSGRVVVALGIVLVVATIGGLCAYVAAALRGSAPTVGGTLVATYNTVPVGLLFGAVALVVFAAVPRLTAGLGLGLAIGFYLVSFLGSILRAPSWVLDLSPFHHVAPAPASAVNGGATVTILAATVALTAVAAWGFDRRDLHPD